MLVCIYLVCIYFITWGFYVDHTYLLEIMDLYLYVCMCAHSVEELKNTINFGCCRSYLACKVPFVRTSHVLLTKYSVSTGLITPLCGISYFETLNININIILI